MPAGYIPVRKYDRKSLTDKTVCVMYKNKTRYAPRTRDYRSRVCMDCKTTILQLMVCVACGVSWIYLVDSGFNVVCFLNLFLLCCRKVSVETI